MLDDTHPTAEQRLEDLDARLTRLTQSADRRWVIIKRESAEQAKQLEINAMNDAQANRRQEQAIKALQQSIKAIQSALVKINSSESHKMRLVESMQRRSEAEMERRNRDQTTSVRKLSRSNTAIAIAAIVLFIMYLKEDIAAGQILDALLSLVIGGGLAGYSIYENSKD